MKEGFEVERKTTIEERIEQIWSNQRPATCGEQIRMACGDGESPSPMTLMLRYRAEHSGRSK